MKNFEFFSLADYDELCWPERSNDLTLESPAVSIFTDFTIQKPLVIEANLSAVEAETLMRRAHVRLKIVVDKFNNFLGLVSVDDLCGQEVMKRVGQGFNRENILVSELMHAKEKLKALSYKEIQHASIGDIVIALQELGSQHCLVIDHENNKIRGIFSSNEIARKLRILVDTGIKSTFSGLYSSLDL